MKKNDFCPELRESYDIVIIGAGPAGLNAARQAADASGSASILLIDKIVPWERPIQCAEGVGRLGLEESLGTIPHAWIRQVISRACFHAPDGGTVTYTDESKGYIINRALMQKDLASELAGSGVACCFHRNAERIGPLRQSFREVALDNGAVVRGRVVIDASGPVAGLGKHERIACKPPDLEPAYFILADDIDLPDDTVHIYMARALAPGGYAWVFPRGKGAANIGIVVGSAFKGRVNIRGLLDAFLARHFPSITIVKRFAGAIPCGGGRRALPIALPGFIKTGDAASTVNPVSRAGISEALLCGKLAGEHALLMLKAENEQEARRIGSAYERAWRRKRGERHEKLARAKNSMLKVPDADYNRAASALSAIPRTELTMSTIFRTALGRFPRIVWAMRHLM
ncbi:MAG: NAD(P)/FAD-dependent oxidoreductase [Chitinispirillaceae bacterium]|nr:NAD(P)/FAD-dependent oxidoreductase [Chitinispirillaceae bacterium]